MYWRGLETKSSWEKAHGEEPELELARFKICELCSFNKIGSLARTSEIARRDSTFGVVWFVSFLYSANQHFWWET